MSAKEIASEEVIDGVKVITYFDGSQHFEAVEKRPKPVEEKESDTRSWFRKLVDWWKDAPVRPYVKVRDLADPFGDRANDPFDADAGSDGKNAAEIGIQIRF